MDELHIRDKHARVDRTDLANCRERGVRLYLGSPVSATLQIRTHTEKLGYYATATLVPDECRRLAAKLVEIADALDARPRDDRGKTPGDLGIAAAKADAAKPFGSKADLQELAAAVDRGEV